MRSNTGRLIFCNDLCQDSGWLRHPPCDMVTLPTFSFFKSEDYPYRPIWVIPTCLVNYDNYYDGMRSNTGRLIFCNDLCQDSGWLQHSPVTWSRYPPSRFLRVKTIPTGKYESFQHVLSSLTCSVIPTCLVFTHIYHKISIIEPPKKDGAPIDIGGSQFIYLLF